MEEKIHSILIDNNISPTLKLDNGFLELTKDISIGFAEFCGSNFGEYHNGIKLWQDCLDETYTTEQLFNEYLNTLK